MKRNKKPARWEFLNELDGRPTDTTPIRAHGRKPAPWEISLYAVAGLLWVIALVLEVMDRLDTAELTTLDICGTTALTVLGICALCLRWAVFELKRGKRCKGALLGTVESFTRRRVIRKNARYPVIRFEVDGVVYTAHRSRPAHPSTLGNEEWVRYNPQNPADNFVSSDSNPKVAVGLTLVTAFLGVAFLIMEFD